MLALLPLHVRFSMTDARFILPMMLTLIGWVATLRYAAEGRFVELPIAGLALTLAPLFRPEMAYVSGLTFLLLLLLPSLGPLRGSLRALWRVFGLHVLALSFPLAGTLATQFMDTGSDAFRALDISLSGLVLPAHNAFLNAEYTPLLWIVLALVGLFARPKGRKWVAPWLLLGALIAALPFSSVPIDDLIEEARYHLPAALFWLPLAALGVGTVARFVRAPLGRAAFVVVTLALAFWPLPGVVAPRSMNIEYEFVERNLGQIPDGCVIVSFLTKSAPIGYHAGAANSVNVGRRHRWLDDWPVSKRITEDCVVLYRNGACSVDVSGSSDREDPFRQRKICRDALAETVGTIAEQDIRSFPAEGNRHVEDPLTIGFYWLRRPPDAQAPGAAIREE